MVTSHRVGVRGGEGGGWRCGGGRVTSFNHNTATPSRSPSQSRREDGRTGRTVRCGR